MKKQMQIGSVFIDPLSTNDAVARVISWALQKESKMRKVIPVNAQLVCLAKIDPKFSSILLDADLVTPDGMSVVWASRYLGAPVPERVSGIDLMLKICRESSKKKIAIYLLGGKPTAAQKSSEYLCLLINDLNIVGINCPPYGFEKNHLSSLQIVKDINNSGADILFVGFGAPKQEYWIEQYARYLTCKVAMGVGCSFDVYAGISLRAPVWMQNAGLEWLYRLCKEPCRLWRRYLVGNMQFAWIVFAQYCNQHLKLRGKNE